MHELYGEIEKKKPRPISSGKGQSARVKISAARAAGRKSLNKKEKG